MATRKKQLPPARAASMAETRAALLDAGARLFAERGLDGPSLDAICERAGYTRGAFYVHFADRDDFLVAVMEREAQPLLDALLGPAGAEAPSLGEVVGRFVDAVASGRYPLTRKGGVRPHQLLDACARSTRLRRRYAALLDDATARLAASIAGDQARGLVRGDVDARAAAGALLAAVVGAQAMLELGAGVEVGASAAALLEMLSPGRPRA